MSAALAAPAGVRYGRLFLRKAGARRLYAVQQDPGRAPRYLQGATWKLVPQGARERITWSE